MDLIRFRDPFCCAVLFASAAFSFACTSTSTTATAPSASKCQVSATAAPLQFGAGGGTGTLSISAARECGWTLGVPSWVSVNGSNAGYGDASLSYNIANNPAGAVRTAEIVVVDQHLRLTQAAAACTYSLSRSGDGIGAAGGSLRFEVATLTGCAWTATTTASWLSVTASSGSSSASIGVSVAANGGAARTGAVVVAGKSYSVSQDAAVTSPPAPAPPSPTPSPAPGPSPAPATVSLSGALSSLSGSCPAIRFTVSARLIVSDKNTDYSHGGCKDISNGDTVKVDGTTQSDGTVLATRIEITKNEK